jgi:predicted DNA-binding transcriptional regulator YafY
MNRFDRLFGILLHLRQGRIVSASDLATTFEVSPRTIYRDVETLSALGIPVYAERGRDGGFGLLEGYFLPPIMFTREEAVSLVIALVLLQSLRARPFDTSLVTAQAKLLAAVPDALRDLLAEAHTLIGFEQTPPDMFHEPPDPQRDSAIEDAREGTFVTVFVQALLDRSELAMRYYSPYSNREKTYHAIPRGVLWDRGHWYLVGAPPSDERGMPTRLFRADRILDLRTEHVPVDGLMPFDVRDLLGRSWLDEAMGTWIKTAPVTLRVTRAQAAKLQGDWYYRYGRFEIAGVDHMLATFGDDRQDSVTELVRWLGPGAELIEPAAWRDLLRDQLEQMLAVYKTTPGSGGG